MAEATPQIGLIDDVLRLAPRKGVEFWGTSGRSKFPTAIHKAA